MSFFHAIMDDMEGDESTSQASLEADCRFLQMMMVQAIHRGVPQAEAFEDVRKQVTPVINVAWDRIECVNGVVRPKDASHQ